MVLVFHSYVIFHQCLILHFVQSFHLWFVLQLFNSNRSVLDSSEKFFKKKKWWNMFVFHLIYILSLLDLRFSHSVIRILLDLIKEASKITFFTIWIDPKISFFFVLLIQHLSVAYITLDLSVQKLFVPLILTLPLLPCTKKHLDLHLLVLLWNKWFGFFFTGDIWTTCLVLRWDPLLVLLTR